jgi:hypothetical protein
MPVLGLATGPAPVDSGARGRRPTPPEGDALTTTGFTRCRLSPAPRREREVDAPLASHPDGCSAEPAMRSPEGSPHRRRLALHANVPREPWLRSTPCAGWWIGLRPDRQRLHREHTARAEALSLTRRPASRRKRRGRGWIPRSLSLVSLGQGRHQPPKRPCRDRTEVRSRAPQTEVCGASVFRPPKRSGDPRCPGSPGLSDGVERIDVHVKERFRRPFSSR